MMYIFFVFKAQENSASSIVHNIKEVRGLSSYVDYRASNEPFHTLAPGRNFCAVKDFGIPESGCAKAHGKGDWV